MCENNPIYNNIKFRYSSKAGLSPSSFQHALCQDPDDQFEDFAGSFLGSSGSESDDRQSVEDLEDEPMVVEEVPSSHQPDSFLSFLENPSQPPMGLRMVSLHAAISKLAVVLPVPGDSTEFSFEVGNLNFSGDTYLYLFLSEIKCLRRLAVLKDGDLHHPGAFSSHASSGALTICSAAVSFGEDQLLSVQHLPKATPWMLTLKVSTTQLLKQPTMASPKVELTLDGCLHGLRLMPSMTAVKAWETCSLALQAILNAISTFGTSGSGPKSAASVEVSPKSADSAASAWCVANFQLWNTLVDLKHISPAPLRSLQLVLPQLAFKATDGLLGFTPPVPQWHVLPPAAEGPEPDFYLYDCYCQPPGVEVRVGKMGLSFHELMHFGAFYGDGLL